MGGAVRPRICGSFQDPGWAYQIVAQLARAGLALTECISTSEMLAGRGGLAVWVGDAGTLSRIPAADGRPAVAVGPVPLYLADKLRTQTGGRFVLSDVRREGYVPTDEGEELADYRARLTRISAVLDRFVEERSEAAQPLFVFGLPARRDNARLISNEPIAVVPLFQEGGTTNPRESAPFMDAVILFGGAPGDEVAAAYEAVRCSLPILVTDKTKPEARAFLDRFRVPYATCSAQGLGGTEGLKTARRLAEARGPWMREKAPGIIRQIDAANDAALVGALYEALSPA